MPTPSIHIYSEDDSQSEADLRQQDDLRSQNESQIDNESLIEDGLRIEDGSQLEEDSQNEDESEPELLPTDLSAGELLSQLEKRQSQLLDHLDSLDQRIVGLLKEVLGERYQEIA